MGLFLLNLTLAGIVLGAGPVFTHGVASGDVTDESAVLWTRVDQKTKVTVEVAYSPDFNVIIFDKKEKAIAENDFTVKFFPDDLPANQTLYYRFQAGDATSETGTFKTAPIPTVSSDATIAFSADTDGIHIEGVPFFNNFEVLDRIREESPDVFVYLGDTIYSDSTIRTVFLGLDPSTTLEEYRTDYKQTRDIPALAELMRSTSVIAT